MPYTCHIHGIYTLYLQPLRNLPWTSPPGCGQYAAAHGRAHGPQGHQRIVLGVPWAEERELMGNLREKITHW